jgi:hypothetical protein
LELVLSGSDVVSRYAKCLGYTASRYVGWGVGVRARCDALRLGLASDVEVLQRNTAAITRLSASSCGVFDALH